MFKEDEKICDFCKNTTYPVLIDFLEDEYGIKKELEQEFIDEYIKTSPEFDQELFDAREEHRKQNTLEAYNAKLEIGRAIIEEQNRKVKCSYCGSSNVKKISTASRVVSTGFFGIASKKLGKQWHCNGCGNDF